jgi:hypothetical protein
VSTIKHSSIAARLTTDRLTSYLMVSGGDVPKAIALYDWNTGISGAFHEDIGRFEVIVRNAFDHALVAHGAMQGWRIPWYRRSQLFTGKHRRRALEDIATARSRARRKGHPEVHGKVIAELNFGFWRFLCSRLYLTSLWVPTLVAAFPHHPRAGDAREIRRDVEDRMQRLHFLRNRIAHHEPIHQRNLQLDHDSLIEVSGWICADTQAWIAATSRTLGVLARHPVAHCPRR